MGTFGGDLGPIYFASGGLWRISPDGTDRDLLVGTSLQLRGATWFSPEEASPTADGRKVMFTVHRGDRYFRTVMCFDVPTGGVDLLDYGHGPINGVSISVSLDGTELAYMSRNRRSVGSQFMIADKNGFRRGSDDDGMLAPQWSPDGRWIACIWQWFPSLEQREDALKLVSPRDRSITRTVKEKGNFYPGTLSWHPDSKRILVDSDSRLLIYELGPDDELVATYPPEHTDEHDEGGVFAPAAAVGDPDAIVVLRFDEHPTMQLVSHNGRKDFGFPAYPAAWAVATHPQASGIRRRRPLPFEDGPFATPWARLRQLLSRRR